MLVRECKLLQGSEAQYHALDEAIRTAQFVRNKAVRLWMDEEGVNKARLSVLCKELAKEFPWARKLNSMARQASAEAQFCMEANRKEQGNYIADFTNIRSSNSNE